MEEKTVKGGVPGDSPDSICHVTERQRYRDVQAGRAQQAQAEGDRPGDLHQRRVHRGGGQEEEDGPGNTE